MARKLRTTSIFIIVPIIFLVCISYNYYLRNSLPFNPTNIQVIQLHITSTAVQENLSISNDNNTLNHPNINNKKKKRKNIPEIVPDPESSFSTESVLLQDWEILVIVSPDDTPRLVDLHAFVCVHYTKEVTHAKYSGNVKFPDRVTFRCHLPLRARKRLPFKQPSLQRLNHESAKPFTQSKLLLIWSNLVYDALTTSYDDDVVVLAKGLIKKQDTVRNPGEFRCVFGDEVNGVRTAVKTSTLEVFRCERPKLTDVYPYVKVSLEILSENRLVPSAAYYTPTPRTLAVAGNKKSLLCACTMVFNVAKFLKEWVYYHSKIGVEKFILYDNGSDDDLGDVVNELNQEGYDVYVYFWLWQKTQEGGFSHSALYAKESCEWMMYVDVDEFVYSPKWSNSPVPSISMLQSLLNKHNDDDEHYLFDYSSSFDTSRPSLQLNLSLSRKEVGQISIRCHEFGPSNQKMHPAMGVVQGYNCRMQALNRHKSIVLLEAVDDSLHNVIHHFKLKKGYKSVKLSPQRMMVNHYKYQAWPEFKAKFRRRVSAYVVDWGQAVNLNSQDRPKGLGASMVEPTNWTTSYCEVHDNRLQNLVRTWFGTESPLGHGMPWQNDVFS